MPHGLFTDVPPPSSAVLSSWVAARGIHVHPGVAITETETGWGVEATQRLNLGEPGGCDLTLTVLL